MEDFQRGTAAVLTLAGLQGGVVTREQCQGLGVGDRAVHGQIARGQWQRLAQGLYLTRPGVPDLGELAWGGVLLGGEGSCVAGRAAAALSGLDVDVPDLVEVKIPHGRRISDQGVWHFTRVREMPRGRGAPTRQRIEETVLDLVAADPAAAEQWVTEAVRKRLTTRSQLRRVLAGRSRFPGRALLAQLLVEAEEGFESVLERDWHLLVEVPHGLPEGIRQDRSPNGRRDLRYGDRLVVELDGRRGHEGLGRFRDMDRDNANQLMGVTTLRFGWTDCHHRACAAAAQVGQVLAMQGFPGAFHSCPNCPA